MMKNVFVFDAQTQNRTIDENNRLVVKRSLLTREEVSKYFGREIKDFEKLGLEPLKQYNVYRPEDELKKCLSMFETLPILDEHIMDYPYEPQKDLRIGSVGRANIEDGGIYASLGFWDEDAIENIRNEEKKELSLGYTCDYVKREGEFNGVHYDLVMENIKPNHVALVKTARVKGAKVFNAEFKENDHPRDNGGKFAKSAGGNKADKNEEKSKAVSSKTSAEIEKYIGKPTDDIEVLKTNAANYYNEYLRTTNGKNKPPINAKVGKVEFGTTGLKKELFNTHYERLKTLPFLRDIVEKGNASEPIKDEKHEFIDSWIYIIGEAEMDGKSFSIQIDVAVDDFGNKFYVSNDITEKKKAGTNQPSIKAAAPASDKSITKDAKNVNGKMTTDRVKGANKRGKALRGDITMSKKKLALLKAFGVFDEDPEGLQRAEKIVESGEQAEVNEKLKQILIEKLGEEKANEILAALKAVEPDAQATKDEPPAAPKQEPKQEPKKEEEKIDVEKIKSEAKDEARKEFQAIETARDAVTPFIGKVAAQDSATAYYKLGCKSFGIAVDGLNDAEIKAAFIGASAVAGKANRAPVFDADSAARISKDVDAIFDKTPVKSY